MTTATSPHPLDLRPPPRGADLPYDDGEPMESYRHNLQMNLLISSLRLAWKDRLDYYAAGNMFIYYSETQARKNDFRGPDVFVVLDTVNKERKHWVVWEEEGKTPDLVIELTSPSTEKTDRGEKMRIYSKLLKVSEYYLFDPFTAALEGFELDLAQGAYRPLEVDEQGRLPCSRLGLSLGVEPGTFQDTNALWLRWFDRQGQLLPHFEELAESEKQRAESLAAKLAEYEQRFGSLES